MIDRDPRYFAPVLNYLRHGKLILDGLSEEGVLEEAEFYNVTHLISLLKERILHRQQKYAPDDKRVYRVMQCQENELTQVSEVSSNNCESISNRVIIIILSLYQHYPMDGDSSNS